MLVARALLEKLCGFFDGKVIRAHGHPSRVKDWMAALLAILVHVNLWQGELHHGVDQGVCILTVYLGLDLVAGVE